MIGEHTFTPNQPPDNIPEDKKDDDQGHLVYHRIPENFSGEQIVPLNELEKIDSELHQKAIGKYSGREELLQQKIEPLNCESGDVVFLSPVHPQIIHDELRRAGFRGMPGSFFKIPISNLEHDRLALIMAENLRAADKIILPFTHQLIDPDFSDAMRAYLKEKKEIDEEAFVHAHLQQIVYKDKIDTHDLEIITVK